MNHNWSLLTCFSSMDLFGSLHTETHTNGEAKIKVHKIPNMIFYWAHWEVVSVCPKCDDETHTKHMKQTTRKKVFFLCILLFVWFQTDPIVLTVTSRHNTQAGKQGKQQNKNAKHTRNGLFGLSIVPPNFGISMLLLLFSFSMTDCSDIT